jgi:hypothetical protein
MYLHTLCCFEPIVSKKVAMNIIKVIALVTVVLSFSGCASITGTTGQSVSVETRAKDKQVSGASCELTNSRGKWYITSPGSTQIRRSNEDLIVMCSKEGFEAGRASVVSDTKGSMFGNILLGGGIGALVDHSNGSAYEYPNLIQIMMGESVTIGTPQTNAATAAQSNVAPAFRDQTTSIAASQPNNPGLPNPAKQLEQLDSLRKKGLITKDEYDTKKSEILKNL